MITTDGQENVLRNLERKAKQASDMFDMLVALMGNEMKIQKKTEDTQKEEIPSWL